MRAYATQVETLRRWKNGGSQVVRVEHNIGEWPNDPSIENRYALRCEILPRADAELDSRIQEPFKVAHSTSGKVVQNHDCPGLCTALRKRAIDPSIRFLPVARNRVPQDAGHALCRQHTEDVRIEQPPIQIAALPEWTKIAVRMGEPANRLLSIADFLANGAGVLEEPERHRVAPGMIADPVALLVRTSSQFASFGRA